MLIDLTQHAHDILVRKHYRKPAWALGTREFPDISQGLVEYVPIEEYERIQRLILRGRRHPALHRQMFQEGAYLRAAHDGGMSDPVEANEVAYPVAVGLFGTRAVAFNSQGGPDPVHQLRRFAVRIHTPILSIHGCTYSIIGAGKKRKRANSV